MSMQPEPRSGISVNDCRLPLCEWPTEAPIGSQDGKQALDIASSYSQDFGVSLDIVMMLLKAGADVNHQDYVSTVHFAVCLERVRQLHASLGLASSRGNAVVV